MSRFEINGTRNIDFTLYKSDIRELKSRWKKFIQTIPPCPTHFEGRGIVICAGGLRYFTCAWINIMSLRRLGCTLPIELWYVGNELSDEIKKEIEQFNVVCRNFLDHNDNYYQGYILKPLSIIYSSFKEILFLDADNVCVKDPEELFGLEEYVQNGAVFWPDYWQTSSLNPIWPITGCTYTDSKEQESGQILLNKEKCWKALNLCLHFNSHSNVYYKLLLGDKDTFRFAWLALKTPYFMIKTEPATCGYRNNGKFLGTTMIQYNTRSEFYFLHRNLLKWDVTQPGEKIWLNIKRFYPDAQEKQYFIHYSDNGHYYMDLQGDVEELNFTDLFGNYEEVCIEFLDKLRSSAIYKSFVTYSHFATYRFPKYTSFTLNAYAAPAAGIKV